jgi:metal-responsive CopG/Arc/MetJ family transcriptional regulator
MKTPLQGESTKDDFIYARIEKELLTKVDGLCESKGFKNRSQAIRCLISWSLENGLTQLEKPEKRKRQRRQEGDTGKEEVIYTRIENSLLTKIDSLRESCALDNRSQTVRGIIDWAFANGASES